MVLNSEAKNKKTWYILEARFCYEHQSFFLLILGLTGIPENQDRILVRKVGARFSNFKIPEMDFVLKHGRFKEKRIQEPCTCFLRETGIYNKKLKKAILYLFPKRAWS